MSPDGGPPDMIETTLNDHLDDPVDVHTATEKFQGRVKKVKDGVVTLHKPASEVSPLNDPEQETTVRVEAVTAVVYRPGRED